MEPVASRRPLFADAYRRYRLAIFRVIQKSVHDRETAEELTQEVFLRAWNKMESYEERGKLLNWLYVIAGNIVLNTVRGPRGSMVFEEFDEGKAISRETFTPEDRITIRELQEAIPKLTALQRRVVEGRLQDLSDKEIADQLGRNIGAIKVLYHRAVISLRVHLQAGL